MIAAAAPAWIVQTVSDGCLIGPNLPVAHAWCCASHAFAAGVQELFPGNYAPTTTHLFLNLLHDKGLLLRVCELRHTAQRCS